MVSDCKLCLFEKINVVIVSNGKLIFVIKKLVFVIYIFVLVIWLSIGGKMRFFVLKNNVNSINFIMMI